MKGQKRPSSSEQAIPTAGPVVKRRLANQEVGSRLDRAQVYRLMPMEVNSELLASNNQNSMSSPTKESQCEERIYSSRSRFSNDIYTVGWISTTRIGYVAAQVFLDEHGIPQSVRIHDNTDYTLGRIQDHNVAIALMPDCQDGLSCAASVARDMLHSFPNIKIGLMIGLAGGAPSQKNDIRLGDIVVSATRDRMGGVFQHDFGKRIQDRDFEKTGVLNQPPTLLRSAVNGLHAEIERKGHRFQQAMNAVLDRNP